MQIAAAPAELTDAWHSLHLLPQVREEIIQVLMWEICKNTGDAAKEFDRTMEYVSASISAAKESNTQVSGKAQSGNLARRGNARGLQ